MTDRRRKTDTHTPCHQPDHLLRFNTPATDRHGLVLVATRQPAARPVLNVDRRRVAKKSSPRSWPKYRCRAATKVRDATISFSASERAEGGERAETSERAWAGAAAGVGTEKPRGRPVPERDKNFLRALSRTTTHRSRTKCAVATTALSADAASSGVGLSTAAHKQALSLLVSSGAAAAYCDGHGHDPQAASPRETDIMRCSEQIATSATTSRFFSSWTGDGCAAPGVAPGGRDDSVHLSRTTLDTPALRQARLSSPLHLARPRPSWQRAPYDHQAVPPSPARTPFAFLLFYTPAPEGQRSA
jgi:hypothetical protein